MMEIDGIVQPAPAPRFSRTPGGTPGAGGQPGRPHGRGAGGVVVSGEVDRSFRFSKETANADSRFGRPRHRRRVRARPGEARRLIAAGAQVVLLDLPSSAGETVAKDLGDAARFSPGDVTSPADVTRGARRRRRISDHCGSRSTARGSATAIKTVGRDGPFPLEAFTRVVTINLIGTFNMIRLAARAHGGARRDRQRARRDREHRVDRRVRRPDRAGGLRGIEGRRRRR